MNRTAEIKTKQWRVQANWANYVVGQMNNRYGNTAMGN